jgi:S-methylmethionine-dependent homocysteine/selenocysteine methylase
VRRETWRWVTDGGLETDLIFHHDVELPEFAAYPLVWTDHGRDLLRDYYQGYARIAAGAGVGLRLETPTWCANPDRGITLGHDRAALAEVNRESVTMLQDLAEEWRDRVPEILVVGMIGPRGDGYDASPAVNADEAADYHQPQVRAFAEAGADAVSALTLTSPDEAIGVVRAADAYGLPVGVSFTVETDGRLPDGTSLAEAIDQVDAVARPAYFMVNCAHPTHVLPGVATLGDRVERIHGLRSNASTQTHAELDQAATLDEGDIDLLVRTHRELEALLPALEIVGGCCGTDARHVAALWGVAPPEARS